MSKLGDMMKEKILVSIVVPVYNVEKYISKCLDSIVNQTYKNIEIIIVNDGSPDNSEEIIKKYSEDDTRIKYIKQKNSGLGAARNSGIKVAKGDYICFIDSDDWIERTYVEELTNKAFENDADIVVCNMSYVYPDMSKKTRTPKIEREELIDGLEGLKKEFIGNEYKFHAPNKFCKRKLFVDGNIWFPEGRLYEDVMTTYKLFINADKVYLLPRDLYYYLQSRSGSIMSCGVNEKRFVDMYLALTNIVYDIERTGVDIEDEIQTLFATNIISLVNYIYPLFGKFKRTEIERYKKYIYNELYLKYTEKAIKNRNISMLIRARIWLIYNHFYMYCYLMKTIKKL